MSSILQNCKRLEVRSSTVEGFGVFATDDIAKGEILEEVPFVLFPRHTNLSKALYDFLSGSGFLSDKEKFADTLRLNLKFKDPEKYYFKWFAPHPLNGEVIAYTVLPLGYGPIYNTSNTDNNAGWIVKDKTFIFKAERDIKKDEEIRTFYGYFVSQEGSIWNCETVYNLALDADSGQTRCKGARFGRVEDFEAAKQNPIYSRLAQILAQSKDGLQITKLTALLPTGEEKAAVDFSPDVPVNIVYQKLFEYRNSQFPFTRITFQYEDKATGQVLSEGIVFRK